MGRNPLDVLCGYLFCIMPPFYRVMYQCMSWFAGHVVHSIPVISFIQPARASHEPDHSAGACGFLKLVVGGNGALSHCVVPSRTKSSS